LNRERHHDLDASSVSSSEGGAPGELDPAQVAREALAKLGAGPAMFAFTNPL
jgi:hypothetical protein